MKLLNIIILLIVANLTMFSQQIIVINEDGEPIENVIVFNKDKSVFTNEKGIADISYFTDTDKIVIKHTSYKDFIISYKELQNSNFKVTLIHSVLDLNEVVISASSWEQNKNEVPNRIDIISKSTIGFNNSQTSADLLKLSGEVFVQKSQLGGGSPMIRGFSANRVLLVVDGVRMNNAIFRSGNLQNVISIDANSVENSEIIFGPGSVIYGSDALGGVMDFHTLRTKFSKNDSLKLAVNSMLRFSSANKERTGHIDFNIKNRKISSITSFSYSDYDDLKMGNVGNEEYVRNEYVETVNGKDFIVSNLDKNIQKFSGFSQMNFLQKLSFKPNKKWKFDYAFHFSKTSNIPRYDRLLQYKNDTLKYAQWYYGPQKWLMNNFTVNYSKENIFFNSVKLTIANQSYSESRNDRKFNSNKIRHNNENVYVLSANLDFEKKISKKTFLFYGSEVTFNKVFSNGIKIDIFTNEISFIPSRYPDNSNYYSFANYVSYKNNLSEIFTVNTGIRYNRVYAYAKLDTSFLHFPFDEIQLNTGAFNGSVGFVLRPKTWQFNFNASSGFRAPNIDDMAKVFDSEPGSVVVPNTKLKPEFAYNIDFGIVKSISNIVNFDFSCFYTYLDNALIRKDFVFNGQDSIMYDGELSKVQAIVNEDNAIIYGFQVALKADISRYFYISTNYNYTKGFDSKKLPLRHVAPSFGSTHLNLNFKNFKTDFFAEYNSEISNSNLAKSEIAKPHIYATDENGKAFSPSWYTLNVNSLYIFSKGFKIKLGVENILNHRYRPYSSGIVSPGRNFIFSLILNFN